MGHPRGLGEVVLGKELWRAELLFIMRGWVGGTLSLPRRPSGVEN